MAYGIIEPTGCVACMGKVQLRIAMYLEPDDSRYEEHHVQVPIMPEGGYPGEVDAEGAPVDQEHYNSWLESLPKEWRDNPFHNHFVYVDADVTDGEIKQLLAESLEEFYGIWAEGEDILRAWKERPLKSKRGFVAGNMSDKNTKKCQRKVEDVIERALEFRAVRNGSD
jgi:hypothetical protein